jgi:zinc protease
MRVPMPMLMLVLAQATGLLGAPPATAAPATAAPAIAAPITAAPITAAPVTAAPAWPQERSDLKPDPGVRFGALANGMRYAIMKNATPAGQVALRLRMATGSLQELDTQQGLAHFLEHMAFRGSARVPDGEVKTTLERLGLKFGPDTNASTGQTQTVYMFDLPRNDPASLDTGLMLLREVGDALRLDPQSFDTERGVVLSEARLNDNPGFHMARAQQEFLLQGQIAAERMPIGRTEVLQHAPVALVGDYYRAYYRPERATLIVTGDMDPADVEARIRAGFSDWRNPAPAGREPDPGVPLARGAAARVFVEAGAPSTGSVSWITPYDAAADTAARERRDLIEIVALAVVNRRLQDAAAAADRKFTSATVYRQNEVHAAKVASLLVRAEAGGWRQALLAAEQIRRQAVEQGVQQAEVDREARDILTTLQAEAGAAATRPTPQLANALVESLERDAVCTSPAQDLALGEAILVKLDAATVDAALRAAFNGSGPLVFVSSPQPIEGGEATVRKALQEAETAQLRVLSVSAAAVWPYTDFGKAGAVLDRRLLEDLGVTLVRFANGVRLNIKPTKFSADQIKVSVRAGNGRLELPGTAHSIMWAANSGAVVMGGLGRLDYQTVQRVLSGKVLSASFQVADDALVFSGQTRPADLLAQLQLLAAYVTDPGWRPESFEQLRGTMLPQLAQIAATPMALFQANLSGLLHAGDARWTFPTAAQVQGARAEELKSLLAPALATGPLEIALVGDVDVDGAIAAVAATFGALPARAGLKLKAKAGEVAFPTHQAQPFILPHQGAADQGVAAIAWPTTDSFADLKQNAARALLADLMQQRLFVDLRQRAGASYTTQVLAQSSAIFPGYGVLLAFADIPPVKAALFYDALARIAADLRSAPAGADEFARALNPTVAKLQQAQQTNDYWLSTLGAVQSEPRYAELARAALPNLQAVTPADVQRAAQAWLADAPRWLLLVAPAGSAPPAR